MALKLSVGFQKKIGLPEYGSIGANCQVDFEVDPSLLDCDLDGFHDKAKRAFSACQQAVNDQLARQSSNAAKNGHGNNGHSAPGNSNGTNGSHGNNHCNSHSAESRRATQSQARAIRAIASKQRIDLPQLLEARFGVGRPENLRLSDASSLIDELKNDGAER